MEKTRQKRTLGEGIRGAIISMEPIVSHIAKKAHRRIAREPLLANVPQLTKNPIENAIIICQCWCDWPGMAIFQMRSGDSEGAMKTLRKKHLFSENAALSFMGHVSSLDGMHREAARLFYSCGKYGNAIRELHAAERRSLSRRDRTMLALAYARMGSYGSAGVQFRLSGNARMAERMHELGIMQMALPMQSEYVGYGIMHSPTVF